MRDIKSLKVSITKRVYEALKRYRMRPDFIIIGSMKCGTTSLFNYLIQHPHIEQPTRKEIHFFDLHFSKGKTWYFNHFPPRYNQIYARLMRKQKILTGEASPYYMFHPHAARRVAGMFPNIKLIVLLRNPVDRAFSHYHHEVRHDRESLTFEEAVNSEKERLSGEYEKIMADENYVSKHYGYHAYKLRGIYIDQLKHWRTYFPEKQFLILNSEKFFSSPQDAVDRISDFLDLPRWNLSDYRKHNTGEYAEQMPQALRDRLVEFYRPKNQELYSFIGEKYDWG